MSSRRYKWEGRTPIGGKPETGYLCDGCGEREEGERTKDQAAEWGEERQAILFPPLFVKGGSERARPKISTLKGDRDGKED